MKRRLLISLFFLTGFFADAQTYCYDFENGAPGWYANSTSGSAWLLDTSSDATPGNHVWGIGLDTNYAANTIAYLYSPVFNFPAPLNLSLCFWQIYHTEIYQDGMRMEYSTDGGLSWQVIGNAGMGPGWYNTFFITSGGSLPGWSGTSLLWHQASFSLGNIPATLMLQFRFVFTSDLGGSMNGYLIDNFCLCNSSICNCTSPLAVVEPSFKNELFISYPNPANDQVLIEIEKKPPGGTIVLSDLFGKEILNQNISKSKFAVDVRNISNGVYFISVEGNENTVRKKIMVLH
jgi:type IX secretion system substrate protein